MNNLVIFVLGLVAGALTTGLIELLRYALLRPKIRILDDNVEEASAFSCHAIQVTNKGRTTARTCQGMITIDVSKDDILPDREVITAAKAKLDLAKFNIIGKETFLMKKGDFRAIRNELLAWSRLGNPVSIDIFPDTYAIIDVGRIMKSTKWPQLHIPSEEGWQCVRAVAKLRRYNITLIISSANASMAERHFVLEPDGQDLRITSAKDPTPVARRVIRGITRTLGVERPTIETSPPS